jgi:hypothetical protein
MHNSEKSYKNDTESQQHENDYDSKELCSEAVQDKSIHHLALIQLTICKLMQFRNHAWNDSKELCFGTSCENIRGSPKQKYSYIILSGHVHA